MKKIRKATVKDANVIFDIIQKFAVEGVLLPRSLNSIYENIRDFWVYEENCRILGVVSLHVYWEDLAEIKSLAVLHPYQHKGIGRKLVEKCIEDAKSIGVNRVFALTYVPEFFEKLGFKITDKSDFPQKVWNECIHCVKFNECKEIPVSYNINPEKEEKVA